MSPLLSHAILRAQSDERLIELAREGHERAFEALVERYRKPLHRHVRRLLPEARAEDAIQQAFINAWMALQRGVEVREPRPWLYRVAQNAALNALRVQGYEYAELRESLRSHAAGPEEDHERRWVMRRTLAGLAALPDAQREALLRTAVEGRSQEQVAAELGLSEGAVRGLVYRARTALRAAATALTPSPLLGWAVAFASGGVPSGTTERIAEMAAGGGTASAGAVLAKAGAVVAVTGALAGGAVAVREEAGAGGADGPAAAEADAVSSRALGRAGLAGGPGLGARAGHGDDRGGRGRGEGHGRGRGRARDRGKGDGHGRSGRSKRDDRGKHGASGDDKGQNGADDHGTRGSSGPGSGGSSATDDRRGTSGSGSGSSASGSGGDASGSGSGSSGPGPGTDSGSSGGGSVSSGDGGSSGSGASGSGSGGGSSGEGSSGSGSLTTTTTTTTSSGSGTSGSGSSGSGSSGSGTSDSSGSGSSGSGSGGR
jgi:RNA polymerase sigma factor (sigma-70 family)